LIHVLKGHGKNLVEAVTLGGNGMRFVPSKANQNILILNALTINLKKP